MSDTTRSHGAHPAPIDPRLVDLDAAIEIAADFADDAPALRDLMFRVITRGAREMREFDRAPGFLVTAMHAIQEADADYSPAADGHAPTLAYAMHRLRDLTDEIRPDAEVADGEPSPDFPVVRDAWLLVGAEWRAAFEKWEATRATR